MKKKWLLFFAVVLLLPAFLFAQRTITGQVVNKVTGTPMEGVTVSRGAVSTLSTSEGKFSISASNGDILNFSYVGFLSQEIRLEEGVTSLKVEMENSPKSLDMVVVTGYTRERKILLVL
jgi:iron complex outermembrane receptor protein